MIDSTRVESLREENRSGDELLAALVLFSSVMDTDGGAMGNQPGSFAKTGR